MQFQRPSFVQEQRLRMNPQIYQSLKLMELPIIDIRERIEEELERNPALEVLEDRTVVPLDDAERREEYDYFEASSDPGLPNYGTNEDSEEHRRFIEGVLIRPETLQEHLLWQLQLEPVDDELRAIAEIFIQNLDDDGFHKEKPETLFKSDPAEVPARFREAMDLVRGLDPQGTCTADYHESLKVQIGLLKDVPEGIEKALDHLDLLEREKFSELAKKTGLNEEDIRLFSERIKTLYPFPGRSFSPADVRYVVPDIQVVKSEGEFVIILNDEAIPVLGINPFFEKLNKLQDGTAARNFVRENIREARLFIQQLNQRNLTLVRVVKSILEFQRRFFLNGPKYLAPLTLSVIAKELKVHETTVSRTANGKYIQCEWGIFEIRYFFTNSISGTGAGGSPYSKGGVKAIISEIISGGNRKLSDKDISDLLDKRGIVIARRTVAKYRKELEMGSSYTRHARE